MQCNSNNEDKTLQSVGIFQGRPQVEDFSFSFFYLLPLLSKINLFLFGIILRFASELEGNEKELGFKGEAALAKNKKDPGTAGGWEAPRGP